MDFAAFYAALETALGTAPLFVRTSTAYKTALMAASRTALIVAAWKTAFKAALQTAFIVSSVCYITTVLRYFV